MLVTSQDKVTTGRYHNIKQRRIMFAYVDSAGTMKETLRRITEQPNKWTKATLYK